MIRTKTSDWRVQVQDENGRWHDRHQGSSPGPAIARFHELDTDQKRLLRNGQPLRMCGTDEQPALFPSKETA